VEAEQVETQNLPGKKPQEFQPLSRISKKKSLDKSRFLRLLKIGPSSRVGLTETVQSTHWKKIPTHEMIHRFSTPVQSKSNRTPQKSSKNPQKIKCFSQKTLDSILEKFQLKLACFSENSAEKKLDSPG
jgi:hypothetical protein